MSSPTVRCFGRFVSAVRPNQSLMAKPVARSCAIGSLVSIVMLAGGCVSERYDWGSYPASIERMYRYSETFSPADEVALLQKEMDRGIERKRQPPPGKWAHLGMLYDLTGDHASAVRCYDAERALYPESETLMTFLKKQ